MSDALFFTGIVLGFAVWLTAHVGIVAGLSRRAPAWRAPIALLVPPLAPYWAVRSGMLVRVGAWSLGAIVYVLARLLEPR